jgi:hypothetical protein
VLASAAPASAGGDRRVSRTAAGVHAHDIQESPTMRLEAMVREWLRTAAVVLGVAAVQWGGPAVLALAVPAVARAQQRPYPEGMTAAERRRYYDAYNASRTPAQWDSIRRATAEARAATSGVQTGGAPTGGVPTPGGVTPRPESLRAGTPAPPAVVSFQMRNRSLLPTRVEVAGNVLDFGPYEKRYVQFPPGSRVHAYDARRPDGRGRLLFTVTRADEGRAFGVRR